MSLAATRGAGEVAAVPPERACALWADALTALQLLAYQPQRLGGVWLRAPHGPVRQAWLQALSTLPLPVLRVPGSVDVPRWLGGLDLNATLQTGRVHEQAGLLRQAHGGLLCLCRLQQVIQMTHCGKTVLPEATFWGFSGQPISSGAQKVFQRDLARFMVLVILSGGFLSTQMK